MFDIFELYLNMKQFIQYQNTKYNINYSHVWSK